MQESDSLVVHHHHHHYYAVQVDANGVIQGVDGGSLQELLERRSRAAERVLLTDDSPGEFIGQCCQRGESLFVTVSDLWRTYACWTEQAGARRPIRRREFNNVLLAHGLRPGRVRIGSKLSRIWTGVSLRAEIVAALESGAELSPGPGQPPPEAPGALPLVSESSETFMQFALRNHAAFGAAMAKHLQSGFGPASAGSSGVYSRGF